MTTEEAVQAAQQILQARGAVPTVPSPNPSMMDVPAAPMPVPQAPMPQTQAAIPTTAQSTMQMQAPPPDPRIAQVAQLQGMLNARMNPPPEPMWRGLLQNAATGIARGAGARTADEGVNRVMAGQQMDAEAKQRGTQNLIAQIQEIQRQKQQDQADQIAQAEEARKAASAPLQMRTEAANAGSAELGLAQAQRAENAPKITPIPETTGGFLIQDKDGNVKIMPSGVAPKLTPQAVEDPSNPSEPMNVVHDEHGNYFTHDAKGVLVPLEGPIPKPFKEKSMEEKTANDWLSKPENKGKTLADFNEYDKKLTKVDPTAIATVDNPSNPSGPQIQVVVDRKSSTGTPIMVKGQEAQKTTAAQSAAASKSQADAAGIATSYQALKDLASQKTYAADQAMADQYFNIIKPGFGARMNEANIRRLLTPGPLADKMTVWAQKLSNGQPLDDAARNDMIKAAEAVMNAKKANPVSGATVPSSQPKTMILNGKTLTLGPDGKYY